MYRFLPCRRPVTWVAAQYINSTKTAIPPTQPIVIETVLVSLDPTFCAVALVSAGEEGRAAISTRRVSVSIGPADTGLDRVRVGVAAEPGLELGVGVSLLVEATIWPESLATFNDWDLQESRTTTTTL